MPDRSNIKSVHCNLGRTSVNNKPTNNISDLILDKNNNVWCGANNITADVEVIPIHQ